MFSRMKKVIDDNNMLRREHYEEIDGRHTIAELIEDANVTKKELHIFSADLTKEFDTLEYWSQAIPWRALGTPKEMVNMLVDTDKGGRTAVILAPSRTTEKATYAKGERSTTRVSRRTDEMGGVHELLARGCTQHNRREGVQDE